MGAQGSCPTLSHKGLAGVKEDLTALDDHALDGQVFPDVLRLTDFIVHDPGRQKGRDMLSHFQGGGCCALWADLRREAWGWDL